MATSPLLVCLFRICICGKQYPGWKTVRQSAAMRHILWVIVRYDYSFPFLSGYRQIKRKREKMEARGKKKGKTEEEGKKNLHSVENDEFCLVLHNVIPPSTRHLGDTVNAPDENGGKSREYRPHKQLKSHARDEVDYRLTPLVSSWKRSIEIFPAQSSKDEQGEHLKDNTRHHQVIAGGCTRVAVSSCGYPSARALEDQGKQIAEDEDPGIVLGRQTGILRPDSQDDVLQGEVDCCRQESLIGISNGRYDSPRGCEPAR